MNLIKAHKEFIVFTFLPIFLFFFPVLFLGKIFLNTDALQYSYPLTYFFQTNYGVVVNSYNFLGFPLPSSFHYGFFNPVYYLVFKLFTVFTGYHLILLADFLLAALFTYLFVRELGQSKVASATASCIFSLSQMAVYFASSLIVSNALWILPACFYFIHKLTYLDSRKLNFRGSLTYGVGLATTIGLAWLSAHQQWVVIALLSSATYFLYRYRQLMKSSFQWKQGLLILGAVLGGFVMGYSQIQATFLFFSQATRANFIFYDYIKWFDPVKIILPNFSAPVYLTGEFLPFIGVVGLMLALIGILYSARQRANYFWLGSLGTVCLLVFSFSPLAILLRHLPIFRYFAQPSRWLYVGSFALAILAGIGVDKFEEFSQSDLGQRIKAKLARLSLAILALFAVGNVIYLSFYDRLIAFAFRIFDSRFYAHTTGLSIDYYHELIEVMARQSFSNISLINPWTWILILSLFGMWLVLKYKSKEMAALLVALNLLSTAVLSTPLAPRSLLTLPTAVSKFLHAHESDASSYRILPVRVPEAQYREIQALHPEASYAGARFAIEALLGNTNILSGIRSAGGYDPTVNASLQRIIMKLESGNLGSVQELNLLGVKYVISSYEIDLPWLSNVFEVRLTEYQVPMRIYENTLYNR